MKHANASSVPAAARVLLIAPHGSYRTAPFIQAARDLGLEVAIASEGRHSLSSFNAHGLHIDLSDLAQARTQLLAAAAVQPFAAVIGTDDSSTELAQQIAADLGLAHNSIAAVRIARRKDLARACLAAAGVAVPAHRRVDLTAALPPQVEGLAYPVVIKPIALSASRGVIRADDVASLLQACARVQVLLREVKDADERRFVLVEQFIAGREVAVEGLLTRGELRILTIFDKPDPLDGPYFEETYYITPTRHAPAVQAEIHARVLAACRAYGLSEGPIHAECRINAQGVWILEVAARTIGGLCGRLLRFGTGLNLEQLVLKHALGMPLDLGADRGGAGVLMIPTPQAGILRRVEGLGAAEKIPYIEEINIQVREGYELVPLPEGASYLGFIFARAPSAAEAEAALRAAHACLNVVVAPLWRAQKM